MDGNEIAARGEDLQARGHRILSLLSPSGNAQGDTIRQQWLDMLDVLLEALRVGHQGYGVQRVDVQKRVECPGKDRPAEERSQLLAPRMTEATPCAASGEDQPEPRRSQRTHRSSSAEWSFTRANIIRPALV